ncbi:MAG TPA: hypothetical protein V6C58_22980 [Allocoleopsis sp.]
MTEKSPSPSLPVPQTPSIQKRIIVGILQVIITILQFILKQIQNASNLVLNIGLVTVLISTAIIIIFVNTNIIMNSNVISKNIPNEPNPVETNTPEIAIKPTSEPIIEPTPEPTITPTPIVEVPVIKETPQPREPEIIKPIPETLTPEQKLIASIENQVIAITNKYGTELIKSIQANFQSSLLTVTLTDQWYGFEAKQQDKLAKDIFQQAKELDFSRLKIIDMQHKLIARNAVVGHNMIIIRRENNHQNLEGEKSANN